MFLVRTSSNFSVNSPKSSQIIEIRDIAESIGKNNDQSFRSIKPIKFSPFALFRLLTVGNCSSCILSKEGNTRKLNRLLGKAESRFEKEKSLDEIVKKLRTFDFFVENYKQKDPLFGNKAKLCNANIIDIDVSSGSSN